MKICETCGEPAEWNDCSCARRRKRAVQEAREREAAVMAMAEGQEWDGEVH